MTDKDWIKYMSRSNLKKITIKQQKTIHVIQMVHNIKEIAGFLI